MYSYDAVGQINGETVNTRFGAITAYEFAITIAVEIAVNVVTNHTAGTKLVVITEIDVFTVFIKCFEKLTNS